MAIRFLLAEAAHLLRRAAVRGRKAEAERLAEMGLEVAVESLMAPPALPPTPKFAERPDMVLGDLVSGWFSWWLKTPTPAAERLVYFWHGHFTTELRMLPGNGVGGPLMWEQFRRFRVYGYGLFGDLLSQIARDPAMLIYLNNSQSRKERPNENWARELMELYTVGEGHYSEEDVLESARAFTGWTVRGVDPKQGNINPEFVYNKDWADTGQKIYLGRAIRTGDEVLEILTQHPQTYRFVGEKLLRFYLAPEVPKDLLSEAAKVLKELGTRECLRWLFTRPEFYSQAARNALVKSPIEYLIGLFYAVGEERFNLGYYLEPLRAMGQLPFNPPNVKGWDGGLEWLAETPLITRLNLISTFAGRNPDLTVFMEGAGGVSGLVKPEAQLM